MKINTWLEKRQTLLTASDALFLVKEFNPQLKDKLIDVDTYKRTKYQLVNEKRMSFNEYFRYNTEISNANMVEGKTREKEIAEKVVTDLNLTIEANGENIIVHPDKNLKLGATPDFYITSFDLTKLDFINNFDPAFRLEGKGMLECKLTSLLKADSITSYTFQVQQQLLCTGLSWAIIAVAEKSSREIGAEIREMHYFFIKSNEKLHLAIRDAAINFWDYCNKILLKMETEPQPSFENNQDVILARILKVKAKQRPEKTVLKNKELAKLIEERLKLEKYSDKLKALDKAIKEKLTDGGIDDGETTQTIELPRGKKSLRIQIRYNLPTLITAEDIQKAKTEALSLALGEIKTKGARYCQFQIIENQQSI